MKHSVELFLEALEEATLTSWEAWQDRPASKDFIKGVKETIGMARHWFKSRNINDFEIEEDE